mmetsp:Transcript_4194/g.13803  ORF Transcript_4194/g.13803 Transcript_4194/m.13803 type:complete len:179 (+) Transcript_4194:227-763(+)
MGETSAQAAAFADVHKLAAEAGLIEADIEKFLDDSLIGDINSAADAEELEASMLERRDQRAAKARVAERAAELLAAELAKERHEAELRQLKEAVNTTREARPPTPAGSGAKAAGAAGIGGRLGTKPYVANLTNFIGQSEAAANAQRLRDENELLRKCVKGAAATPGAFMEYLKMQGEI